MAKLSGITATNITWQEATAPSTPASTKWVSYFKTDGLYYKDDAGAETGPLAASGGGVSSGTAMPGGPSTGDLFVRTDIEQGLLCTYDGTRWVGPLETVGISGPEFLAATTPTTGVKLGRWALDPTYQYFLLDAQISVLVATTNNGSNYYQFDLRWANQTNSETSLGTVNTSADTATNWYRKAIAVNAALDSTARILMVTETKPAGSPGGLYFGAQLRYRRIFT